MLPGKNVLPASGSLKRHTNRCPRCLRRLEEHQAANGGQRGGGQRGDGQRGDGTLQHVHTNSEQRRVFGIR